jgi:uncharacterized membrane protein
MFADEGATLYSAHLSWSNLWAQSRHVDLVLLPYYVLMHFWSMLSGNIEWVRTLSLFAYFGTIVVVGGIGLRIAGRWCGIIAAALTATSTLLILKSLNARPYALSALLVAFCAVTLLKWLDDDRPRWLWAFSILAILVTASQLFALLAPASMLICVVAVRPGLIAQRTRALLAPVAVVAVAAGAWIAASIGEVGQVNWIANVSTGSRLSTELRGPVVGQLYDLVVFVIVVLALAKLAAIWNRDVRAAVGAQVSRDRDIFALAIGWAVLPTVVLSIASISHPIYANRYVTASAPGAALLVAFVFVRVFPATLDPARTADRSARRGLGHRMMALFGAVAAVLLVIGYLSSASAVQEDLQGPARYAAQHARRGDVIALPDHAITAAINYYLAKDNRVIPLWPQLGVRQRYVEGFDLSADPSSSSRVPRRVWLVNDGSVARIAHFGEILSEDGYVFSMQKQFAGVTLQLYHLAYGTTTSVVLPSDGAMVSGHVLIDATVSGTPQLQRVVFQATGLSVHDATIGVSIRTLVGWADSWDTNKVPNGSYRVRSVLVLSDGARIFSPFVAIHVDNTSAS